MKLYNIELIIYKEETLLQKIKLIKDEEYAYILHDKDIEQDTGELKKPHYHLQIYSQIQKSIKSWSKKLEVKENEIQKIEYKPKAIQYLIHLNNKEKYQYNKKDIQSNFNINGYFKETDKETAELKILIELINNVKNIKLSEILEYALDNNIWSTYRRNYTIIKDYLIEKRELTKNKLNDILKV